MRRAPRSMIRALVAGAIAGAGLAAAVGAPALATEVFASSVSPLDIHWGGNNAEVSADAQSVVPAGASSQLAVSKSDDIWWGI
ncbi:hypothetical protein [Kitasatospora sp. NBC_01266]|uniref:hypothetical protein n=1 Tax=Kitasatospora sp. NBC_01266 TaxID=2903572 RepID=UPI002E2F6BA0|nr:hypothetical protein [Kitasatospora sp. NBC_01266]